MANPFLWSPVGVLKFPPISSGTKKGHNGFQWGPDVPPAPRCGSSPGVETGIVSKLPAGERRALSCLLRRSHQPRAAERTEDGRARI